MKTREEVETLKKAWFDEPIWDIKDTEGFEDYITELTQYQKACEFNWEQQSNQRLQAKAASLGIPGNLTLAKYIDRLEDRINELENRLYKHMNEEQTLCKL